MTSTPNTVFTGPSSQGYNDNKVQASRLHPGDIIALVTGITAIFIGFVTLIFHLKNKRVIARGGSVEMEIVSSRTNESVLQNGSTTVNNYMNNYSVNAYYPLPLQSVPAAILNDDHPTGHDALTPEALYALNEVPSPEPIGQFQAADHSTRYYFPYPLTLQGIQQSLAARLQINDRNARGNVPPMRVIQ